MQDLLGLVLVAGLVIGIGWLVVKALRTPNPPTVHLQDVAIEAGARPATLVRVYQGKQQADAIAAMRADAERLAASGYQVSAQSWAPGQWGCGAFLLALVLFLVLIGILVFIYMLLVKPDGTLTVTYTLRDGLPLAPAVVPEDVAGKLAQLADLRDRDAISAEEYAAKKAELLARL